MTSGPKYFSINAWQNCPEIYMVFILISTPALINAPTLSCVVGENLKVAKCHQNFLYLAKFCHRNVIFRT